MLERSFNNNFGFFSLQEMKFLPSMEIFCKVWVTARRLQFSSKFDLVRLSCKPADELLHHRHLTIINQIIIIIISNTNSLLLTLNLFKYWNQVTIPQPVLKCKSNRHTLILVIGVGKKLKILKILLEINFDIFRGFRAFFTFRLWSKR